MMLMDESDKTVNGFVNSQTYREKKDLSNHGSAQWKVESWFERDFFSNYHWRSWLYHPEQQNMDEDINLGIIVTLKVARNPVEC